MRLKLEAFYKLLVYIYILKGLKDNFIYIYVEMSCKAVMLETLETMIMEVMLDETLIRTKLFNPYSSYYREFVLDHLTPNEERAEDKKGFSMFGSGEGGDFIYDPLEEELIKRAKLIFDKDKMTFMKFYEDMGEDNGEESFIKYMLDGIATNIITENKLFQYKFNTILLQLEEDYKKEVLEKIAFEKIKRNELFILGLSMKVSIRDCGELIECY